MAEASRSVRKTENGRKVITRTTKAGTTIKKVKSAKGADGKRQVTSTAKSRTKADGSTVKKRTTASGRSVTTKTKESGKSRKIVKQGDKTTRITTTTKRGKQSVAKRGSAKVKAANKLNNATTETKGKAGRVKRLQERMANRSAKGKSTENLQKKIKSTKQGLRKKIGERKAK